MRSLQHHYGANEKLQSTPNWRVGDRHQFGAEEGVASANNIKHFREERGWMRPELAKRMGTTPQQIERLEKGQRGLSIEWIDKAATALRVEPWEIIVPVGAEGPFEPTKHLPAANDDETAEVRRVDLGYAMGPGTNIDDYVEEGTVRFDLAWLKSITRAHTDMLFVARGDGDSMSPTLINDDTVLVDTSQRELNLNDRIWAVSVYGAGMIKRIRKIAADRVAVLSDNKDVPPQEVDMADLHIVGRVVWVGRRV